MKEKYKVKKIWMVITLLLVVGFLIVGCSGGGGNDTAEGDLELTLEELAQYNGKGGNPAYVAVDGVVYDVSESSRWADGEHNGFEAGNDLTEEIKNVSPHGTSTLSRMPVVGKIVE